MAQLVTQIVGSELQPTFVDIVLYSGCDQIVRLTIPTSLASGIAGQSFLLELRVAYDDPTPALSIVGTINDPVNAVVDFIIPAASAASLVGRYVANCSRTDAGNACPLAYGQARAVQMA